MPVCNEACAKPTEPQRIDFVNCLLKAHSVFPIILICVAEGCFSNRIKLCGFLELSQPVTCAVVVTRGLGLISLLHYLVTL